MDKAISENERLLINLRLHYRAVLTNASRHAVPKSTGQSKRERVLHLCVSVNPCILVYSLATCTSSLQKQQSPSDAFSRWS